MSTQHIRKKSSVFGLQSSVCSLQSAVSAAYAAALGSYPLSYRHKAAISLNACQSRARSVCFTTSMRPGSVVEINTFAASTSPIRSSPQYVTA